MKNEEVRMKKQIPNIFVLTAPLPPEMQTMNDNDRCGIRYSIFDPTGNITALVDGDVWGEDRASAAAEIMKRHPDVEQVGFVRFPAAMDGESCQVELKMSGGEFCGNASMCAAGLYLFTDLSSDEPIDLKLRVSGAMQPVHVRVHRMGTDEFAASILMPPAVAIEEIEFSLDNIKGFLPLIRMEGISHVIIEPDSPFFALKETPEKAELAVKAWCGMLSVECLGLMFLERRGEKSFLTPLVYVPACQTVFWERSCASGTAAVGMYLAERTGAPLDLTLNEPGGSLRVTAGPERQHVRLYETIRCIAGNLTLY